MIYICIPTHNEQQTVGVVLWKLKHVLTHFPRDYQLLVADDASTDKTAEVLDPYTRVLPLTVIRSEKRQGWAASLEMLLREAVRRSEYPKRDVIVTLQADFSEEPDDLVPLVKRLEAGADLALGNKVSTSKETRARRFARSLARFFMRRQKWPEGVMTPFEGYRAYRLYAVKRAIEDRAAARLIRHEGWAGHAELLRAVLPHARRVDVVDVDDRPDRLQRPRREKPFAAAMQVRLLAAGTEPPALIGVEELDRIALTASRSRDRGAITRQSINASGAAPRSNGSRSRQTAASRRDQGRSRSQNNGTARARPESGEGRQRPDRAQTETRTRARSESRSGAGRPRRDESRPQPRQQEGAAPAEEPTPRRVVADAGAAAPDAAQRPKRKRRRRKRSGQGGASVAGQEQNTGLQEGPQDRSAEASTAAGQREPARREAPAAEDGIAGGGSEGLEESGETGGKKRRRRGGRRGGRGRRKPRPEEGAVPEGASAERAESASGGAEGASADGPEGGNVASAAPAQQRPLAEPAARTEND